MYKNMYMDSILLVDSVKRDTLQNQLILWGYFFTLVDVIDNLSSNTQHMCPWMQIHMLYFDHQYQVRMYYYFLLVLSMFNIVIRCRPMLHNGLQADQGAHKWHLTFVCSRISSSWILKRSHMTLANSMLSNISPLHTTLQYYHLKYPNALC